METFFGILILLIIVALFSWRLFAPSLQTWLMHRVEDRFRKMAGMPTRKEERKQQKRYAKAQKKGRNNFNRDEFTGAPETGKRKNRGKNEPIIPKEYAEDVEFVEIKSYSSTEIKIEQPNPDESPYIVENQIEDVEFTEIKITSETKR